MTVSIRYGLVGTGYFGADLGRQLACLPGAEVRAVYDPENAEAVAVELDATLEPNVEALCRRPDLDAIVVASPNWAHKQPVLLAAAAGKHVFCEKPIALSLGDCVEMLAATRKAGTLFMAGHVTQFMTGVRRAKRLIAEGVIGEVLFSRAVRTGWEEPQPSVSWKKRRELSGGHLYHHIHELDLVQSIMGPARVATMVGGNVAHRRPQFGDEDDLLLISLEFDDRRFAALEYGSALRWPEHHVLIEGTLGAIKIDMQDVGVQVRTAMGTERFPLHRTAEEDADRSRTYRDGNTAGAIRYGAPGVRSPLWLRGIIEEELFYFHGLMQGSAPSEEFQGLTDGTAATAAIATADALTTSLQQARKVVVQTAS